MYWRTKGFATNMLRGGGSSDLTEPGDLGNSNSIVTHACSGIQGKAPPV